MTDQIRIEKVAGGYIVSEANPEPKNATEQWVGKSIFSDFPAAVEEIRRRFRVSDIIASEEGKFIL